MNLSQARVIDPIQSNVVLGYTNDAFVGLKLLPPVMVKQHGGKVIEFGKDQFLLRDTRRADGAVAKRIDVNYSSQNFALEQHSLDAVVPDGARRDAEQVPGIKLATEATNLVMDGFLLGLEYEIATKARLLSTYAAGHTQTLTALSNWQVASSTPRAQIKAAMQIVRRKIGRLPNTLIIRSEAVDVLDTHPDVRDRLKYTSTTPVTAQMLATYFGVANVLVGDSMYAKNLTANFDDVWGNDAVLAYVPNAPALRTPAFGYTYILEGHPSVEMPRRDADTRSWVYGMDYNRAPVITANAAGFLIQNVI